MNLYEQFEKQPEYAKYLYRYGFLIATNEDALEQKCSILTDWKRSVVGSYHFWIHPDQKLFL